MFAGVCGGLCNGNICATMYASLVLDTSVPFPSGCSGGPPSRSSSHRMLITPPRSWEGHFTEWSLVVARTKQKKTIPPNKSISKKAIPKKVVPKKHKIFPNRPEPARLTMMAARNVGKPSDYKSRNDYLLALRAERWRLRKEYDTKDLIVEVEKRLNPGGVTEYRKDFAQVARLVCSLYGSTRGELAKFFRVSENTITLWLQEYPEFNAAVNDRSTEMNIQIMQRLARRAMGFYANTEKIFYDVKRGDVVRVPTKEYHPPSESAIMFWLKNRMPEHWKDVKQVDVDETRKLTMEIYRNFDNMTSEQASDAYQELLKIESGTFQKEDRRQTQTKVTDVVDLAANSGKDS